MTLYLDTSALVKLYVREAGSEVVRGRVHDARHVVTAAQAYAEARSALAQRQREGALSEGELERILDDLDTDWPRYVVVELRPAVVRAAGELAERHGLSAGAGLHLAAALELEALSGLTPRFVCFDPLLSRAAADEGLDL